MSDYNDKKSFGGPRRPGGFAGGRPSYGPRPGGRPGGDRDFNGPRELYKATCNNCGNACEVPFRPNGKKPVYCRDCFVKDGETPSAKPFQKREFGGDRAPSFRPSHGEQGGVEALARQITTLEKKIDALASRMDLALKTHAPSKAEASEEPTMKKLIKKATAPKKAAKGKKK